MKKNRRPIEPFSKKAVQEVSDFIEIPVAKQVLENKKCLLKLDDMWLLSWKPYIKTSLKSEAITLERSVAESYLPIIKFYRKIKAEIIPL